jgi:hypothetical protein
MKNTDSSAINWRDAGLVAEQPAAAYIGSSVSALQKGRQGVGSLATLPFVKIGKSVRYRRSDLETFVANLPTIHKRHSSK